MVKNGANMSVNEVTKVMTMICNAGLTDTLSLL